MIAITNFWTLQEKNPKAFDAVYKEMKGDAYFRRDLDEALSEQETSLDMSDYNYFPVVSETTASYIERLHKVKLTRAAVKKRPDVGPNAYELV